MGSFKPTRSLAELRERKVPVPQQAQVGAPTFLCFQLIFLGLWLCRKLSLPHKGDWGRQRMREINFSALALKKGGKSFLLKRG